MIKPTVGRVVWFTPSTVSLPPDFLLLDKAKPCSAMVAYLLMFRHSVVATGLVMQSDAALVEWENSQR